jgi:hypothetical protein
MNRFRIVSVLAGGIALLLALSIAQPANAQDAAGQSSAKKFCEGCSVDGKTTPRTADGHPDLNGFWAGPAAVTAAPYGKQGNEGNDGRVFQRASDGSILFDFSTQFNQRTLCFDPILKKDDTCQDTNQPSYKPEYFKKVEQIASTEYQGSTPLDPQMDCKPLGLPRASMQNTQIVQTPGVIAILYSAAPSSIYRLIYTDGRPHPSDLETSFMGHSIGHWEGDTLVVDTVGLNDETWLAGGVATRLRYANIHSDQEHVIEHLTRTGDVLTYQVTVEDPVMLTKPWALPPQRIQHGGAAKSVDDEVAESICTVNDKNHFVKPTDDQTKCAYRCDSGDVTVKPQNAK